MTATKLRALPGRALQALSASRAQQRALRQLALLDDDVQQRLTAQLRERFTALEHTGPLTESPWWSDVRRRLYDHVFELDPRTFLTWPEIQETMFVSAQEPYVAFEHKALLSAEEQARWKPLLEEDPAGCPLLLPGSRASANLVHHAYHLMRFEAVAGPVADMDEVIEYGGGYGSLARLLRRRGYRGRYHIHDFPELGALQQYYLASVAAARAEPSLAGGISCASHVADLPPASASNSRRLFVAWWSLSETPVRERDPWIDVIGSCSHVFIAFQHEFEQADNREWFARLRERVDLDWRVADIAHVAGGHTYLIGTPR